MRGIHPRDSQRACKPLGMGGQMVLCMDASASRVALNGRSKFLYNPFDGGFIDPVMRDEPETARADGADFYTLA